MLVVRADSPFQTLDDPWWHLPRKIPQSLTVGGSGTFLWQPSGNAAEWSKLTEADVTYIPFTGTGPLPACHFGGAMSGAVISNSTLGVQLGDDVRVLAVASEETAGCVARHAHLPRTGLLTLLAATYRGVAPPKGTAGRAPRDAGGSVSPRMNVTMAERQVPMGFQMTDIRGQDAVDLLARLRDQYGDFLTQ